MAKYVSHAASSALFIVEFIAGRIAESWMDVSSRSSSSSVSPSARWDDEASGPRRRSASVVSALPTVAAVTNRSAKGGPVCPCMTAKMLSSGSSFRLILVATLRPAGTEM